MFLDNGIYHRKNFLKDYDRKNLVEEINLISNSYLFNGITKGVTWINKNLFELSNPIVNILSVNLLEIAIDVYQIVKKETQSEYKLTMCRIICEKLNSNPLDWHTDQRKGTIRCLIYIEGGDEKNGSLGYLKGTHKENNFTHKINPKRNGLEHKIFFPPSSTGDLIFFDINGYHKKNTVSFERKIIMLEFQKNQSMYEKEKLVICNSKMTKKVLNNIDLFCHDDTQKLENPVFSNSIPPYTPFKVLLNYMRRVVTILLNRIFLKFKIKFKN